MVLCESLLLAIWLEYENNGLNVQKYFWGSWWTCVYWHIYN